MSEEPLNLRRSLQILRRHLTAVGLLAMLGLLAGAGYTILNPPMYASNALVALAASTRSMTTQVLIAGSDPVLRGALRALHPAMSLQTLRSRVQVTTPISYVLSINAEGETAAQAKATADAVAFSYIARVGAADNPGGQVPARILEGATNPPGAQLPIRLSITAGIGALLGALSAAIGVLALSRSDRRLRQRDEIADAIGVPVLASLPVRRPPDAAYWAGLLEDYEPSAADSWRLRNALRDLGLMDMMSADAGAAGFSLLMLSLSSDHKALALGPQLAVFAASLAIPTTLVIGPHQNSKTVAALRAACVATPSSKQSRHLRVAVADHGYLDVPDTLLSVVVAVADDRTPQVTDMTRTDVMVLGVSAGAATAEQLARVAAGASAEGRHISGILVADPDPGDPTTGRLPQLARQAQMPTRVTGTAPVIRR